MTILARLLALIEPPRPQEQPRTTLDGYRDQDAIRGLPDRTIITHTHRPMVAEVRMTEAA